MGSFACSECNKSFNYRNSLNRHMRKHHEMISGKFQCNVCDYRSHERWDLKRHMNSHQLTRELHQLKCPLCLIERRTKSGILEHYVNDHNIEIRTENLKFSSEADFLKWKVEKEIEQVCNFVVYRARYVCNDGTSRTSYKCYRDGIFRPTDKRERKLKGAGSNKIGGHCPAKIDVTFSSKEVNVSFCATHVGHKKELDRMRLQQSAKNDIVRKIEMNVSFDEILDDIKTSVTESRMERIHLLTRKDIYNIRQQCYFQARTIHQKKGSISVDSGLNEVEQQLHKRQNKNSEMQPELKLEDKLSQVNQRHAHSLSLDPREIIYGEDVWIVLSENKAKLFEVRKTGKDNCSCDIRCTKCNACIHIYVCSCHDSSVNLNMCKHIHLVAKHTDGIVEPCMIKIEPHVVKEEVPSTEESILFSDNC